MTTTENTRTGVWISAAAVGTDYVRISADIPNDRLAEATRALAAVVNTDAPKGGMPSGAAWERTVLADDDACRRVDDVSQDGQDGPDEAQPTKIEALLEEAVELLKSVALSVAPPVIRLPKNAAFAGRVKAEDLARGVWSMPADDMRAFFAGTTLADEDACRRVDDVDQDGPDCEGPEGGESA